MELPEKDTKEPLPLEPLEWAMHRLGYLAKQRRCFMRFALSNGLPLIRVGPRKTLVDPAAIEAWLARRMTANAAQFSVLAAITTEADR
jgi:hypothetical protein